MKIFFLVVLLSVPLFAFAEGLVTCSGPDCNFCTFMAMVDKIIDFLFVILTLGAVMVMMFAGFKLVLSQGSTESMSEARGMLTNVVVGFVMVMAAWLIVDTMMKALIDPSSGFGMWNEIGDCGGIGKGASAVGAGAGG